MADCQGQPVRAERSEPYRGALDRVEDGKVAACPGPIPEYARPSIEAADLEAR